MALRSQSVPKRLQQGAATPRGRAWRDACPSPRTGRSSGRKRSAPSAEVRGSRTLIRPLAGLVGGKKRGDGPRPADRPSCAPYAVSAPAGPIKREGIADQGNGQGQERCGSEREPGPPIVITASLGSAVASAAAMMAAGVGGRLARGRPRTMPPLWKNRLNSVASDTPARLAISAVEPEGPVAHETPSRAAPQHGLVGNGFWSGP